jgi:hypothetical protein
MASRFELRCVSIIIGKRSKIGIILLIIISLLSLSLQPSMFILFESNLRGTHGTNPRQYPSSASQV